MNWIGRKIHLYNVTIGLYMLDWWERYLFNILPLLAPLVPLLISCTLRSAIDILMVCLLWYILRYAIGFFQSNLKTILQGGNYLVQDRKLS
ncbi:hypothetical protein GUJ93_ZPchr0014g47164 [Zizania palustris]|uniref:Uncharacterized protein n=1 Tax=Zizania palustris TaxID=103762 RepID=A0A8J5W5U7_ZIZPA|nr:hypothetical protein GUJ93_ZPchr0014g47164 [Zizania palustris]